MNYRDLPELVGELGEVLKEPNKAVLFHYICQLLPNEAQAEFDRVAATTLAGGKECRAKIVHHKKAITY